MKTHFYFFKTLLVLGLVLVLVSANSQNLGDCGYVDQQETPLTPRSGCDNSSDTWLNKYRTPGYWIPDENTPIKTILVNWVVCRDDNGENGWQDIPEFHEQVDLMFSNINEWYSNSQPKGYSLTCEPNYTHVYDTRIRFELNDIIFIDNTAFNESCWAVNGGIIDYIHQEYPESKNVLNHIFTQPPTQCLGGAWGYYSIDGSNNTAFVQTWYSMYDDSYVVWEDHIAHIAHEYGHAVGQHHTYNGEKRCTTHYDFLDDVFGLCAEPTCTPCSSPCTDDYVCYLTYDCFWQYQTQPFSLMSGVNNSRYISPKSAGRMHRALSLYENNFLINNKPMHKYVKEDHSFQTPLTIIEDETWDFAIKLYQDIVIESGYTLTISCDVKMPIDGKIIVKQGGHLIVDGGLITSANSEPWQGIQVWGDKTAHQFPDANGNYQQGYLELKNGAIIENAIIAVDLWEPDNWSSTGGIVHAIGGNSEETKVVFRNNTKSVHALHYNNYHPYIPTQEMDYNSYFKNCIFEITEDYLGAETFYKHVDLAYVNGINIQACDFSIADNVSNASDYTHGIAGYDAKFRVSAICNSPQLPCPEEDYDKCTFTGFYSAISDVNDGAIALTFSVNRANFINNSYGVKTRNINNASVLFSNFEVGHLWDCGAGIYADNVTGFAFEENTFSKFTGGSASDYFGIIINNSEAVNEVYNNDFDGLSYANFSDGRNFLPNNYWEGLAYYCNENENNYADFYIDKFTFNKPSGIQTIQGGENYVAGNTFTQSGATWHYYNGGGAAIVYYCNQNQVPTLIEGVVVMPSNGTNSCPSHYGGNSELKLVLTLQQKADAEQDYYYALADYNNVKSLYDSYIDGGDTESEKLDIQTAQPDDMWALRAQLLGDSPHLSFDVLKEAADKTDVFTESVLFDILAANPDELKKDTLISYLENKEEPLPNYMIVLLKQLAEGTTYKTALQQQMAGYKHNYSRAAHDIIRSNLNDTVTDYNELRNWLDNLGGITSDRQIITSYISEGNFTDAITLANMLPSLYNLEGTELMEHNYYMDILSLHQTLYQQGRNTFQLTSVEKADILFIANNSNGVAGSQAKSILEAVYNEYYVDCPEADGATGYKSSNMINPSALGKAYGLNISVKPNPAKQWAAFDYTLPGTETNATITITNVTGSTVEILELTGQQGQKLWDTRSIKSGVYIYTLKTAGFSQSGKIIVSK